jgi:hypothetical protein
MRIIYFLKKEKGGEKQPRLRSAKDFLKLLLEESRNP